MINCQYCINWVDETLQQIEADKSATAHIFMGCRIHGLREKTVLESCPHHVKSENLFTPCITCRVTAPKTCVSLGECANCTDTDLFCLDHCIGGDQRKYCSHFVRLCAEGVHLIDQDRAFDLFPAIGMPRGQTDAARSVEKIEFVAEETASDEEADPDSDINEKHPGPEDCQS